MNNDQREIIACEVCGSQTLTSVLDLGLHPMCDDLVRIGDTRLCREYPIEILFCSKCVTGHQRFQVPKRDLFPDSYHYRSRFTADVLNGMAGLVDECAQQFGSLQGKTVLDVGCNDGSLLDFFREKGATTLGIEPTAAYMDAKEKGHIVRNDFLSENVARSIVASHGRPDFVTFTNVFAHIEDLHELLRSLRLLLAPETVVVIENHYLGAVLEGKQFDTFYHEHPRTYSYTSFVHIAKSLEARLIGVQFPSRYGGNIRVFMTQGTGTKSISETEHVAVSRREAGFGGALASLRQDIEHWQQRKRRLFAEQVRAHGKLPAKAFPGRAAILVKMLGLDERTISAVYEKPGSLKIGHYVPGTRIPIRSDDELFLMPDKTLPLVNLAWHINTEIHTYLGQRGYTGPIIDILSKEDFATAR